MVWYGSFVKNDSDKKYLTFVWNIIDAKKEKEFLQIPFEIDSNKVRVVYSQPSFDQVSATGQNERKNSETTINLAKI